MPKKHLDCVHCTHVKKFYFCKRKQCFIIACEKDCLDYIEPAQKEGK